MGRRGVDRECMVGRVSHGGFRVTDNRLCKETKTPKLLSRLACCVSVCLFVCVSFPACVCVCICPSSFVYVCVFVLCLSVCVRVCLSPWVFVFHCLLREGIVPLVRHQSALTFNGQGFA